MSKLSAEKQEELRQKMEANAQRAQLQQIQQQNSRPANFGSAFGMQSAHGAYSNIMSANVYNPYVPPMYAPQPVAIHPQMSYGQTNNSQARILQTQPVQFNAMPMSVPQPQPMVNPMNMYGNNMNPMGMMNPMGGMGFNPLMGMQPQQSFNPFNPFNGGGFGRMW